jgi:hypothetical protein
MRDVRPHHVRRPNAALMDIPKTPDIIPNTTARLAPSRSLPFLAYS